MKKLVDWDNLNPGSSFVSGYTAGKKLEHAQGYLDIAQGDADIRQETHSWKKEDRQKESFIQAGMAKAGQDGGYNGVIDFLQAVDPTRALGFHKAKIGLDNDILGNQVLQATSQTKILGAMVESYGILGKMGHTVMKAPEGQQNGLYQSMLPMVQKVNPNAPTTFNESAKNMFLLASAQASPASQVFGNKQEMQTNNSKIGKLSMEIGILAKRGATAENNPTMRA